jgi:hypothetical protein
VTEVNPFAPPIHDEAAPARSLAGSGTRFFLVSRTKFAVMSLATLGFYDLYWFYQNWKLTKAHGRSDIWPIARAIFALFFTHALLRDVVLSAAENGVRTRFSVQPSAWGFIILSLLWRLPDPFSLISVFAFVPLLSVQDTINDIHDRIAPNADRNSSFGPGNWVAIVIGLIFWALVLVGMFVPEEALQ